jgi:hypothetical protein
VAVVGHAGVLPFQFGGKVAQAKVEQAGLDVAQACQAPGGHHHLMDQKILGGSDGLVFGLKGLERFVEMLLIFAGEDGGFGGKTVAQGVEADGGAAFGSLRAGAELGVPAIGVNLLLGRHGGWFMVTGGWLGKGIGRTDVADGRNEKQGGEV